MGQAKSTAGSSADNLRRLLRSACCGQALVCHDNRKQRPRIFQFAAIPSCCRHGDLIVTTQRRYICTAEVFGLGTALSSRSVSLGSLTTLQLYLVRMRGLEPPQPCDY